MPAILVSGVSFAVTQYLSSNFLGPELPDILSALVSIVALAVFLQFWKPKTIFRFKNEEELAVTTTAIISTKKESSYTGGQIFKAWSPFLVLTALVSMWGIPIVKKALVGQYEGSNIILKSINFIGQSLTMAPEVPGLHNKIINVAGETVGALYKLEILGAAGTAILIATIITKFIVKISWKDWAITSWETINELKYPILTIGSVVGFAYVTNASGMSTTLGMTLAKTGMLFPFFSPFLGWLGVFITGSDTSFSNLLFGALQKVTATSIGMDPILAVAANSSGGVTGKMISPQSIAVACAAVGLAGKESDLFRFTIKHSLFLVSLIGVMVYLQHTLFSWMIPS